MYGSSVRLPENKQFKLQHINKAEAELNDSLGREPSLLEISEHAHIPLSQVSQIKKHAGGEVNISNLQYTPVFVDNGNDDWLHFVYHDLPDLDKVIFEHKTGFGGKKVLSNEEIGKLVNLSPSTVGNRAKMISDKMVEHWSDTD
jgi:DNA-directed RNA polymerase specialized sigma subunit